MTGSPDRRCFQYTRANVPAKHITLGGRGSKPCWYGSSIPCCCCIRGSKKENLSWTYIYLSFTLTRFNTTFYSGFFFMSILILALILNPALLSPESKGIVQPSRRSPSLGFWCWRLQNDLTTARHNYLVLTLIIHMNTKSPQTL